MSVFQGDQKMCTTIIITLNLARERYCVLCVDFVMIYTNDSDKIKNRIIICLIMYLEQTPIAVFTLGWI